MENEIWKKLYIEAKKVLNPRTISDNVEAGDVAAALLTKNGNIYTGVCIDTACSLGFCAERNAIGTMITNGENEVIKLLCIGSHDDNIMMPCGACRELLLQICDNNKNMEIITDLNTFDAVKLIDLMPRYWK
jgi:cytidine deaminase